MAKYLFIIESPGKQKKIQSYLGKEFLVMATKGHIMDLPEKKIGVDLKKDFATTYEVYPEKKELVKEIQKAAKESEIVYLATDKDREGEIIASLVRGILPQGTVTKRVTYNAITKSEIEKGIEEAGCIDINMVYSAETRRVLDRIVGYKASWPTKQATGGTSAGRVQSAALRIIAEREKEIRSFIPEEYWPIDIIMERENGEKLSASIKIPNKMKIKTEKDAQTICDNLKNKNIEVSKYETKQSFTKPYAPFTTSSMYQAASSILNWGADKTAKIAQNLYESSGLITYIRTDSSFIVPEFINRMRNDINNRYGQNYLSDSINFYGNKANAQEAHEAIRPTDINNFPSSITTDDNKLYNLIWRRTTSSQMKNMEQIKGVAEFTSGEYVFVANGSKTVFDGWKKVWTYGSNDDNELPVLIVGEKLKVIDIKTSQKFTEPPSRYNEATIIKKMEDLSIGRPSTYATIITTLLKREYVVKDKKSLSATDMGIRVSDFLVDNNFCFIDLKFSAELEEKLDCIAQGNCNKLDTLNEFWIRLQDDIAKAKTNTSKITNFKCKKCDGFLEIKHSRFGSFMSCQNRTNKEIKCDYKCDIGENGEPKEKEQVEINYSDIKCNNCEELLLIRKSKKGNNYLSCRNWKSNKLCSGFFDMSGQKMEFKKKIFKKWTKKKESP